MSISSRGPAAISPRRSGICSTPLARFEFERQEAARLRRLSEVRSQVQSVCRPPLPQGPGSLRRTPSQGSAASKPPQHGGYGAVTPPEKAQASTPTKAARGPTLVDRYRRPSAPPAPRNSSASPARGAPGGRVAARSSSPKPLATAGAHLVSPRGRCQDVRDAVAGELGSTKAREALTSELRDWYFADDRPSSPAASSKQSPPPTGTASERPPATPQRASVAVSAERRRSDASPSDVAVSTTGSSHDAGNADSGTVEETNRRPDHADGTADAGLGNAQAIQDWLADAQKRLAGVLAPTAVDCPPVAAGDGAVAAAIAGQGIAETATATGISAEVSATMVPSNATAKLRAAAADGLTETVPASAAASAFPVTTAGEASISVSARVEGQETSLGRASNALRSLDSLVLSQSPLPSSGVLDQIAAADTESAATATSGGAQVTSGAVAEVGLPTVGLSGHGPESSSPIGASGRKGASATAGSYGDDFEAEDESQYEDDFDNEDESTSCLAD